MYSEKIKARKCAISISSSTDFNSLLDEIEQLDTKETIAVRGTTFERVSPGDPEGYVEKCTDLDEEQKEALKKAGGYVLVSGQKSYSLLSSGFTSYIARLGLECQLTSDLLEKNNIDTLKQLADIATDVVSGEKTMTLIMRGGNVLYCGSTQYSNVPPKDLFGELEGKLRPSFPTMKIDSASYSHENMEAKYELSGMGHSLLKPYKSAWVRAGYPEAGLNAAKPTLVVKTSDAGKDSVTFIPSIEIRGGSNPKRILLSQPMYIKHVGDTKRKIEETSKNLVAGVQQGVERLAELMEIELEHPKEVLVRAMKYKPDVKGARSLKEITSVGCLELLRNYGVRLAPGATAFEVYMVLNEIIYTGAWGAKQKTVENHLMAQEAARRTASCDFEKLDREMPKTFLDEPDPLEAFLKA